MDPKSMFNMAPDRDPLAAIFQKATVDKAKGNEFSNTDDSDESSDPINHLLKVIPHFLSEVCKNNQIRSTDAETASEDGSDLVPQTGVTAGALEGHPVVSIGSVIPPQPSVLPVSTSIADRYTRSMLKCLVGYPLYEPRPSSELSTKYLRHGVNIGDVGFVRGDGTFDFLFNVCPSKNGSINPPNLPECFILDPSDHSVTQMRLPMTCLFQNPVIKTKSDEYICKGPEGAILELPEGAIEEKAMDTCPFSKLAACHGVQWYEYSMARDRDISNGSLCLITSSIKCAQWGIAVFDRKCEPRQGLKFDKKRTLPFSKSTTKYHWKGSRSFHTKVSDLNQGDGAPNQCVFLRGYKIMIRQDIFDSLCKDQPCGSDEAISSLSSQTGSIGVTWQQARSTTSKRPTIGSLLSPTQTRPTKSDEVISRANLNLSSVHPSNLINAALLSQNPGTKVALTHDDVWCDLLRDNFPKIDRVGFINISQSYTTTVDEYGCITLEKISKARDLLERRHHPFQGIKKTALPGSLTTSVVDYTPISGLTSISLPRELVERILLFLETKHMLKCRLVNKWFNEIIQSSTLLQYVIACAAAGVIDNPRSPLSYAERLKALKKREDAWRMLEPVFQMKTNINYQTLSASRPAGGALFVNDNNQKDLNYCHLPSFPQDNLNWIRIPGHGPARSWPGVLINYTTAIYEHDLIVNFISSEIGDQADMQQHSLDFILLKLSTGGYHPHARYPRIHIQNSAQVRPYEILSRIVGDNLALIIQSNDEIFPSKLFIFDWKTGHKLLQHESTAGGAYSSLVFVSPEFLLVPNHLLSELEVWHIPQTQLNPKPPIQILSLRIPAISPGYSIFEFRCHGEPNSFSHAIPYHPPKPFSSSPENSIIVFTLRMSSGFVPVASYNFIIHRCALLDAIKKWTLPSIFEQRDDLPMWLTNEVVLKTADPQDGSDRLGAQSKSVSWVPHSRTSPESLRTSDSQTFPTWNMPVNSGASPVSSGLQTASSTLRYTFLQVQWADWGPPISRWFQVNDTQAQWMRLSSGQRYAFCEPSPQDRMKSVVSVVDFNPYNYRNLKNAAMMVRHREEEGDSNGGNDRNGKEKEELEILDHRGVFLEEVYMGLKCLIHRAPDEYEFDVVLMDEERLFGVKLNDEGQEEAIKILYIG